MALFTTILLSTSQVAYIYKQLGFNLLVFSLSSGTSPRPNVGGWVLPVHSQQTLLQGVVTYMLPVEAFATAIKFF